MKSYRSDARFIVLWAWALCFVLAIMATSLHAARQTTWTLVELPGLGYGGSTARAINNRGDVVGIAGDGPTADLHAMLWQNGVATRLPGGTGQSMAFAINEKGTVAGIADGITRLWKDGQMITLSFAAEPLDINRNDAIVGTYWTGGTFGFGRNHAFVYQDGVLRDLGTLGGDYSIATGINDKGVVVGGSWLPRSSTMRGFVWKDGVMTQLGTLGGAESGAGKINNHGMIVGTASAADGSFYMVTFDVDAGTITPLMQWASASDLNDRGQIVGVQVRVGRPFLYDDGQITWLDENPALKAGGWTSFFPASINDRGWIAGWGWKPGTSTQGTALLLIPR